MCILYYYYFTSGMRQNKTMIYSYVSAIRESILLSPCIKKSFRLYHISQETYHFSMASCNLPHTKAHLLQIIDTNKSENLYFSILVLFQLFQGLRCEIE